MQILTWHAPLGAVSAAAAAAAAARPMLCLLLSTGSQHVQHLELSAGRPGSAPQCLTHKVCMVSGLSMHVTIVVTLPAFMQGLEI